MSENNTPTVEELQTQLEAEREARRREQAKAVDYEKRFKGIDPDKYRALSDEIELLRNEKASNSGDPKDIEARIKAAKEELRQNLAGEIDGLKGVISKKESELKELRVDSKVFAEAAGHFVQGFHNDLKRYIRESCDIDDEGNIVVKDTKGEVRYSPANKAKPMSVAEFIEELKQEKEFAVIDKSIAGGKQSGEKRAPNGGAKITSISQLSMLSPEKQREVLASMTPEERLELGRNIKI